jgi:hypothetical protein
VTEIQTARLLLRPWQPDDLAEFTRLLTDPEVTRYIVVHTPFSPQDVAELSARTLEQWERNGFGPWACAPAKAPGHDPGPCCWPPRDSQTGGMVLLSPGGTTVRNSAEDLRTARLTPGLAVRQRPWLSMPSSSSAAPAQPKGEE